MRQTGRHRTQDKTDTGSEKGKYRKLDRQVYTGTETARHGK